MRVKIRLPKQSVRVWAAIKSNLPLSISLLIALVALALSEVGHQNHLWRNIAHILLASYCLIILGIIIWKMADKTRYGNFSLNFLLIIAAITALVQRQYWTTIAIITVHYINELVVKYANNHSQDFMKLMRSAKPHEATIIRGRKTNVVACSQVQSGDKIMIEAGRIVPVDCEIIEGETQVNESLFSGQIGLVNKAAGDWLLAGSLNTDGEIIARALQTEENSQYENLVKMLRTSANSKTQTIRQAERFVIPFTALCLLIAGGAWLWSHDSKRFLDVLVVATPSGLLLGSTLGIKAGLARAAKQGIFIKSAKAFEDLANLKTLAFDKVGIVTSGHAKVSSVQSFDKKLNKSQILLLAGSLLQNKPHLLAAATIEATVSKNIKLTKSRGVELYENGLSGYLGRQNVVYGSKEYLSSLGFKFSKEAGRLDGLVNYIGIAQEIVGAIVYQEDTRDDAHNFIDALHKAGVTDSLLITRDSQKLANEIAVSHGISSVMADITETGRIVALESIPASSRPLGYIGDGNLEGLSLSTADVGIAINCGARIHAGDSARVIIIYNDILKAANSVSIARANLGRTQLAILGGILLSLGLMGGFALGKLQPFYGPFFLIAVELIISFIVLGKPLLKLRQKSQQAYNS